jgi:hypothetical protein
MDSAVEAFAPMDGNWSISGVKRSFRTLKRTVRRRFIEITVLGNQITASQNADGKDL